MKPSPSGKEERQTPRPLIHVDPQQLHHPRAQPANPVGELPKVKPLCSTVDPPKK